MVNSRALLGFFVVILLIVGGIFLVRRSPSFFSRFRVNTNKTASVTPTPATLQPSTREPVSGSASCSPDLIGQQCSDVPESTVCGYERVVGQNGSESVRSMHYRNACTYCSLYGSDGVLDLGDTKYYAAGYVQGVCGATK